MPPPWGGGGGEVMGGGGGGEVMGTALIRLDQVAWMLRSKQVANVLLMCC
jgi:hypothetical protein